MTAQFKTGDIIYQPALPGHVQMIYQGAGDTLRRAKNPDMTDFGAGNFMIHAQYGSNFHIDPKGWLAPNDRAFRSRSITDTQRLVIRRIADLISLTSKYRAKGIGKLVFSTSKPGMFSDKRLDKYNERLAGLRSTYKVDIASATDMEWAAVLENLPDHDFKLVTAATCAEATVLCYQLGASLGTSLTSKSTFTPAHYINLSARGTMPVSLFKYLVGQSAQWQEISTQMRQPVPVQGFGFGNVKVVN